MVQLTVSFQCGCYSRSGHATAMGFKEKAAAKAKGDEIVDDMNNNHCGRHRFELLETDNGYSINVY